MFDTANQTESLANFTNNRVNMISPIEKIWSRKPTVSIQKTVKLQTLQNYFFAILKDTTLNLGAPVSMNFRTTLYIKI